MTPEREAQMREMFEKWQVTENGWDMADLVMERGEYLRFSVRCDWITWLACARALEPMVRDGERWRTFERALRTGRLPGAAYGRRFKIIETCPMSGDKKEFNAFVEAIDAAMSAALEDGNA